MQRILFAVTALLCVGTAARADSSSLLSLSKDGTKLLAANTDNDTITLIDLKSRKAVKEIKVGRRPEAVAWTGPNTAVATLYDDAGLAFVDLEKGEVSKLATAVEPYGVVISKDGAKAYVTHDYPGQVSEIDLATRKALRTIPGLPFNRGIALGNDGASLYIAGFYTAELARMDLKDGRLTERWTGQSVDNLCRHVEVHPMREKAYLSHIQSRVEVFDAKGSIFPHLSVCDLFPPKKPDAKRRKTFAMDTFNGVYVVANPWESAVSPDGKRLYAIYAGTEDMNIINLVDDDYEELDRVGRAIKIGKNPRAVKVSPDGKEVYIYNTLDFEVAVLSPEARDTVARIKTCEPAHSPEWVRGKFLFHSASVPMTGQRWISCSGCHPDGQSDGRVWHNPEGLRKTPSMAGLAHTHPLHWSADRDEVQDFEFTIEGKLMKGRGLTPKPVAKMGKELDVKTAGMSKDLDALAIYNNSFRFTLSPHNPAPGKLSESAARGKELFFSKEVNCSSCHSGPYYTDSSLQKPFKLHDVGTGDDPAEKLGPKYDTPTLLGLYRTAPYLHHGKAATLMDVLTTFNPKDQHGKTSHLDSKQKQDLVEFLRALPYEMPPEETPNTVKYFEKEKK